MLQPGGVSLRPMIVNSACTPPSDRNRTSLIGPLLLMILSATSRLTWVAGAAVICGFVAGLEPPAAGKLWQPPQLVKLNRGPKPSSVFGIVPLTDETSLNASKPVAKNFPSISDNPVIGPPAPAAPVRTPGSVCASRDGTARRPHKMTAMPAIRTFATFP